MKSHDAIQALVEGASLSSVVDDLLEGRGKVRRAQGGRLSRQQPKAQAKPMEFWRRLMIDRQPFQKTHYSKQRSTAKARTEKELETLRRFGVAPRKGIQTDIKRLLKGLGNTAFTPASEARAKEAQREVNSLLRRSRVGRLAGIVDERPQRKREGPRKILNRLGKGPLR